MIILFLFLTIFSFFSIFFFSRNYGIKGLYFITVFLNLNLILLSVVFFTWTLSFSYFNKNILLIWLNLNLSTINLGFLNDILFISMLLIVICISSLVHLFSLSYMDKDPHLSRFVSYLSLFTFFMVILIISPNFLQLFIGWEGVGLCSYLLISFWYNRNSAIKSALKAILVNRIGDIGFIIGFILIWIHIGSLNFNDLMFFSDNNQCSWLGLFFILAAAGKSAQFGLHSWLPDAMEGPTPVSALIHAATMVTAGVFLILRLSKLFVENSSWMLILILLGSLTAIFAASVGLLQNDFKKVIAYSTCSQLGYMIMIIGIGEFSLSLFHLFNHAFFKSLLFLSAGSIIHSLNDDQDFRKTGKMKIYSPITFCCFIIGSLALMGFPFLTAFYSKDLIIELSNISLTISFSFWLGSLAAFFTAFYSIRMIVNSSLFYNKSSIINRIFSHESNKIIIFVLIILSLLSVFMGYTNKFLLIYEKNLEINFFNKQIPILFTILGSLFSIIISYSKIFNKNILFNFNFQDFFNYLNQAWLSNQVNNNLISRLVLFTGDFFYHLIDRQFIEKLGPWRITNNLVLLTSKISFLNSGAVANIIIFLFFLFILIIQI